MGPLVAHHARTIADTHPGCGSQKELGWQQRLAGPQRRRGRLPTVDPRVRVSHRARSGRREHQVLNHTHTIQEIYKKIQLNTTHSIEVITILNDN